MCILSSIIWKAITQTKSQAYDLESVLGYKHKLNINSMASARERTIPTERPPPVSEGSSANFSG
jgi:hypothetical protein